MSAHFAPPFVPAYFFDRDAFVVPQLGAVLPPLCPICGAPGRHTVKRSVYWYPQEVGALAFASGAVFAVLALATLESGTVYASYCDAHARRASLGSALLWLALATAVGVVVTFFCGFVAVTMGPSDAGDSPGWGWVFLVAAQLLVAATILQSYGRQLRSIGTIREIRHGRVRIALAPTALEAFWRWYAVGAWAHAQSAPAIPYRR